MVNSVTIRAIRKILSSPGLSWSKVCILCGGPDWPTSVLTGILRLNLASMLCGSMPIIFLIVPTVAAGALQLKVGGVKDNSKATADAILAVAGMVQAGAL